METKEVTTKEYLEVIFNTALAKINISNAFQRVENGVMRQSKSGWKGSNFPMFPTHR